MVGFVSSSGRRRNSKRKALWIEGMVALAALFALLVIRSVPPHFSQHLSIHHPSVKAVFSLSHKPHFDSDRWQWSAPVKTLLPFPPAAESSDLRPACQMLPALQTEGFHYNRPPPAG
jgi:hypothetical protein